MKPQLKSLLETEEMAQLRSDAKNSCPVEDRQAEMAAKAEM
jgi:hypothetical protein